MLYRHFDSMVLKPRATYLSTMATVKRERLSLMWQPVAKTHSIASVRTALSFAEPVPERLRGKLREEFESRSGNLKFQSQSARREQAVRFGKGDVPVGINDEAIGWDFTRFNDAGSITEVFSVIKDQIEYITAEYHGWQSFKERFSDVVSAPTGELLRVLSPKAITLDFVNQFVFDLDDGLPDASFFEPSILNAIDQSAIAGHENWHLHRGWFENHSELGAMLFNQNFDSDDVFLSDRVGRRITVLTRVEARGFGQDDQLSDVAQMMEAMHERCKSAFRSVLNPSAQTAIGIDR